MKLVIICLTGTAVIPAYCLPNRRESMAILACGFSLMHMSAWLFMHSVEMPRRPVNRGA
jgi:hypothetical protein